MVDMKQLCIDMGDLEDGAVMDALQQVMDEGGEQAQEALKACQDGMNVIGDRFEEGEYFVSDLIFAGDLMTEAVGVLKDALVSGEEADAPNAKMILCTVQGDLHDIGKNIVRAMLEAAGFTVVDLGIDVPADKIIETIKEQDIHIVALSGVLTLAVDSMKTIIDEIATAGLRDTTKIIIGGTPTSQEACDFTGADEWAFSPQKTVSVCAQWAS